MEDAHATILSLPPADVESTPNKIQPAFFAVYDGHGGPSFPSSSPLSNLPGRPELSLARRSRHTRADRAVLYFLAMPTGSTVAKFTGATLHTRLSKLPTYAAGDYEIAMRRAFLQTDEDLRASEFLAFSLGCRPCSDKERRRSYWITRLSFSTLVRPGVRERPFGMHGRRCVDHRGQPTYLREFARVRFRTLQKNGGSEPRADPQLSRSIHVTGQRWRLAVPHFGGWEGGASESRPQAGEQGFVRVSSFEVDPFALELTRPPVLVSHPQRRTLVSLPLEGSSSLDV